jgi:hypothetical protein
VESLVGHKSFTKRPEEVIPVPIRKPEDLFKLPEKIQRRIQRQLELEEFEEFLRIRGDK